MNTRRCSVTQSKEPQWIHAETQSVRVQPPLGNRTHTFARATPAPDIPRKGMGAHKPHEVIEAGAADVSLCRREYFADGDGAAAEHVHEACLHWFVYWTSACGGGALDTKSTFRPWVCMPSCLACFIMRMLLWADNAFLLNG